MITAIDGVLDNQKLKDKANNGQTTKGGKYNRADNRYKTLLALLDRRF